MQRKAATATLVGLVILQTVMLLALFAGVEPHPPATIALFGMAPFLAVSLSTTASALILGPLDSLPGKILTGVATAMALLSFGPQKYFDPQFPLVWPAVIAAQVASVILIGLLLRTRSGVPDLQGLGS